MNRVTQWLVLLALASAALAVGPAPATPQAKGKEAIAQERIALCADGLKLALALYERGSTTIDVVANWSRRMIDSQRNAGLPKDQLAEAIKKHLEFLSRVEAIANNQFKAGLCQRLDVQAATYARLEAEQWLAEAEGR